MSVGGERRAEILDMAARLFASSGLRTSLKEIADACGILPGSLYHHFDSKEAIIVEIVERYHDDLDAIAKDALDRIGTGSWSSATKEVVDLGNAIAACAVRHRAALLLTLYDPPSGAGDQLVRVSSRTPLIDSAMLETLRAGQAKGEIRSKIDLETFADRLCQVQQHIGIGVFREVPGAETLPEVRCRTLLNGLAVKPPSDRALDRSAAFTAASQTIEGWEKADDDEDERLPMLRAVARTEFGRRGYEATTVRDIAKAAAMSVGSVYRLIGSKDELLNTIMQSFTVIARSGWSNVLKSSGTTVEKLDALMWININAVGRFSDEYNIQLAWLRESPPNTTNLGTSFAARMGDLKSLLAQGIRSGELHVEGPSSDIRAWSVFELLWMPENIVRNLGPKAALTLARETTLRGAARR